MQDPNTLKNPSKKLMALTLMLLMIVTPMSVYAQSSSTISEDLGEVISINVVNNEPASLVSTQIEATDVPVYVFLKGITLGSFMGENAPETEPFISNPNINRVVVTPSGSSSSYVRGIKYQQPNKGSLTIDNLGYVIVTLRQIKDETKVPEEITLNMSARIYFDLMRGFAGASSSDLALRELNEDQWKGQSYKNSFWNGKGYLRLVDIENNVAKIQVYDSAISPLGLLFSSEEENQNLERYNERGVLLLSKGDIKTITIPGSSAFFHDQVRIKLNKIGDIQKEVKLKVESMDGTDYKIIVEDMSIASGSNWKVYNILEQTAKNPGEKQYSVILRNGVGEKRTLMLTKKQEGEKGTTFKEETTDENLEENKKNICDESVLINEDDSELQNKLSDLIKSDETDDIKKINARKLYCTAISHYEQAMTEDVNIRDQVYRGIGEAYFSLSDFLTDEDMDTSRSLALYYLKRVSNVASVEKSISAIENQLFSKSKSEPVYLEDEGVRVTLLDVIIPPVTDKTSATIEDREAGASSASGIYYEGDTVENIKETDKDGKIISYWKVINIYSERVVIQKYVQGKTSGSQTLYLDYEQNKDVDGHQLTLKKVDSKKSAYVTVMPGGGDTYSESSFMIHIPIEKRLVQWTPGQIDKMINETTKQIEILDRYISQLDSMIKSWKYVCFATFAWVTIKNSFLAGADRNMARKDVMPRYNKICEKEVALGQNTFDKCMNNHAKLIEDELNVLEQEQQKVLECNKKGEDCFSSVEELTPYYPQGFDKNTMELGAADKIESSEWLALYKCKLYEKKLSGDGLKSLQDECKGTEESITAKQKAMSAAITATKNEISVNKDSSDKEKAKFVNSYNSKYKAALRHTTYYGSGEDATKKLEDDFNEINTKLAEMKMAPLANKENIKVEAYSSGGDKYNLISVDSQGQLMASTQYEFLPATQRDNANNPLNADYKVNCVDTKLESTPDCVSNLNKLTEPLVLEAGEQNYRLFKDGKGQFYAALETIELTDVGERNNYASNAKAQFDNEGRPYCIPTGENGNFIKVLSWYATGDPDDCEYWNVGVDGEPCSGDDLLKAGKDRITAAIGGKCTTISKSVGSCKDGQSKTIGKTEFACSQSAYRITQIGQQTHCQDVMDPSDCKILFAVCDPVMCPPSRFNLGGKYPLTRGTVVDTGIIGSIVLGLPNFPDDPVPVCLPGILAGLRSIRSLLEGFKECLSAAKIDHENIGICDKIRSVGVCKLFWQELINIFKLRGSLSAMISGKVFGVTEGSGGEYLNFNQNINAVSDSVKYFTSEYGSSAFAAFKGRSTAEMGSTICEAAIYGKFGDVGEFVDQLAEAENPPQFTATFDEAPWAVTAGRTYSTQYGMQSSEQSMYSVYYFIYAGNIPDIAKTGYAREGVKYAVYLRDDLGRTLPVTVRNSNQLYDTVPYDGHRDVSVEKLGPRGMNKICVYINGKEDCGFGKVSTAYSINALNDRIVKSDALTKSITSADKCVSDVPRTSSSLGGVILPQEYGLISSGIVRTCSILNPGKASESDRWQDIGTCGQDKQGNSLGKCWIDMSSVSVKNIETMEEIQKGIISTSAELNAKITLSEEQLKKYFSEDKAKAYYEGLEAKRISLKGSDLINLFINGVDSITYKTLIDYSLNPSYKILAQISTAEIYASLAGTVTIPKPETVEEETIQSAGAEKIKSGIEEICSINGDCASGYCEGGICAEKVVVECRTRTKEECDTEQETCMWTDSGCISKIGPSPQSLSAKVTLDYNQKIYLKNYILVDDPSLTIELTNVNTADHSIELTDNHKLLSKVEYKLNEENTINYGDIYSITYKVLDINYYTKTVTLNIVALRKIEKTCNGCNQLSGGCESEQKCNEFDTAQLDCYLRTKNWLGWFNAIVPPTYKNTCLSCQSNCIYDNTECGQCNKCSWSAFNAKCVGATEVEKDYYFHVPSDWNVMRIVSLFYPSTQTSDQNFIANFLSYKDNEDIFEANRIATSGSCVIIPLSEIQFTQLITQKPVIKQVLSNKKSEVCT